MRIAVITLGVFVVGVVYLIFDPSKGYLPECPFYKLTNLYCPGCGSQRSLHALLNGNISGAIGFNPLVVISLIYFAAETVIWFLRHRGKKIRTLSSLRYTPVIVLIVTMVFWILRNIPFAPFTVLAP